MVKRVDKIIADYYFGLSRSDIKSLIKNRGVFILHKDRIAWEIIDNPAKKIEDNIQIKVDADKLNQVEAARKIILKQDPNIKIDVIYEDSDIAVIEKPAGIVVHPSQSHKTGTLANGLLAKWPRIAGVGENSFRPGIVHRLDKDVSGVMAVAKTQGGFQCLKKQFHSRTAKKTYIALVYNKPPASEGVIHEAIIRSKSDPTKQVVSESGKEAITKYRIISAMLPEERIKEARKIPPMSLIEARPLTGRMHQIRVHLASIGCPIAGDKKYLPKNLLKIDKFNRIMLHSQSLEIELIDGTRKKFESRANPF